MSRAKTDSKGNKGKVVRRKYRLDKVGPDDASRMAGCAQVATARVVAAAEGGSTLGKATAGDWSGLTSQLYDQLARIEKNDLADAEQMLFGQAVALQTLFVRLTEGALAADNIPNYDMKFRYALRAQAQCRATLETLSVIKNPPVIFARQANVSAGPQQVNNGVARAGEWKSSQNELSGEAIELRQNGGTPKLAFTPDPALAAVGALNGSAHNGGHSPVISERLERRRPARASRAGKGPPKTGRGSECRKAIDRGAA
jgi:hypothetical protein